MPSIPLIRRQKRTHFLQSLRCVPLFQCPCQCSKRSGGRAVVRVACAQDSGSDEPPKAAKDPWHVLEAESLLASGTLLPGTLICIPSMQRLSPYIILEAVN
jgi:hypothetical protein